MSTTLDPAPPADQAAPPQRTNVPPYGHGGWRGLLREFAVIVAGVLCALAAQAWWDAHQERGRERDYLRQLLADTRENERRLNEAIGVDSAAASATGRVVDALTATTPPPPADSLVAWVQAAGAASNFEPVDGTYRSLVGTGDLRLVRNDSLRALLASYTSRLASEDARQGQLREAVTAQVAPLARALPFMRRVFLHDVSAAGVDVAALRANGEAASVLFAFQAASANRLSGLRSLRGDTRALLHALQAEPGAGN